MTNLNQKQKLFCLVKRAPELPIELHISFTPRVFPASFQKHFFVESAELEGVFHSDIQQRAGRIFTTPGTIQKPHLQNKTILCINRSYSYYPILSLNRLS